MAPVLISWLLSVVGDSSLTQGVGGHCLDHNRHHKKDVVIFITVTPVCGVMSIEYLINIDINSLVTS